MKKTLFFLYCGLILLLARCDGQKTQQETSTPSAAAEQSFAKKVPYKEAENYYFRHDAQIPDNPKINTREEFESLFGMAAVMGKNGEPTSIDFDKQFVIAVVLPVTNKDVELNDERLIDDGHSLIFEYSVDYDEDVLSFEMQPFLLIVVDRKYERDNVVLKEVLDD